jgi:hypothetical protein
MIKHFRKNGEAVCFLFSIIEADRRTDRDEMKQKIKANQEQMLAKMEANTKAIREDIKTGQAEMRSTVGAIEEKMDVWTANMTDDRKERTSC